MVNDCGKSSWRPSSLREVDPVRSLARDGFGINANLTECISFNGGATLRPTEGNPSAKTLEFGGDSEAAGLYLERGPDGKIDPAQSLAVQYRGGQLEPTPIVSLMPVLTGEGITLQGAKCGFVLHSLEAISQAEGTIRGSGIFVWPPESVVRDSTGKCTLTFAG